MTQRRPSANGVEAAAARLAGIVTRTPLLPLDWEGRRLWVKAECLQQGGSFKLRGATNRLLLLSDEERKAGVVAFSSGNHAQGVARAARALGLAATIVMPRDAPAVKVKGPARRARQSSSSTAPARAARRSAPAWRPKRARCWSPRSTMST